ncbi:MAG: TOMM precursor leader peptide-binding protein [Minicystis sp.]
MEKALRLKRHLRAEAAASDLVFLLGEHRRIALRGRAYGLLIPLLDGRRSVDEITATLAAELPAVEIHHAIARLEQQGYVTEDGTGSERDGFWEAVAEVVPCAPERLAATPVAVRAMGGEDVEPATSALVEAGLIVEEHAPLIIVVTGDYLHPDLEAWNRRARDEAATWVPVKPGGIEPWIGPVFQPGPGPCWACLAARIRHNRPVEAYLERRRGEGTPLLPSLVGLLASRRAALSFASVLVATWIASGGRGPLSGHGIVSLDLIHAATATHPFSRRPQCPVCGDPTTERAPMLAPVTLDRCPKRFSGGGGHRSLAPEETFARLRHHVSPITGIVASLGPAEGRDHPLRPLQVAVQRVCPGGDQPAFDAFHRVSSGKGGTVTEARVGALSEAIERYSSTFSGREPLLRARLAELGSDGIHPGRLLCFSEAQYRERERINSRPGDPRHAVPPPFDEEAILAWMPAWSLTHGRRRWVPAAYCLCEMPAAPEERSVVFDPSGHAAGNTLEEAVLQGFLERVERDAVGIWWYNRARRPAVDLASFGEPGFQAIEDHHRSFGARIWVLDVTTDLGIPAFAALARSDHDGRHAIGFGCHLEARIGVHRALAELQQIFDPSGRSRLPWDVAAAGDDAYLRPDTTSPPRTAAHHLAPDRGDLRDDVLDCVARADCLGLETIVVNLTRPDTGLHVVHVIVPGLRHIWPRFAPGRLYDTPVALGWLPRPTPETDLNPAALLV